MSSQTSPLVRGSMQTDIFKGADVKPPTVLLHLRQIRISELVSHLPESDQLISEQSSFPGAIESD